MMFIHKKDEGTSTKISDRLMLVFWDSEKIGGIPNDIFPLVITSIVGHFDMSLILIDGGSSSDIMYSELFEKMGPKI